jgi:hypothetical protein
MIAATVVLCAGSLSAQVSDPARVAAYREELDAIRQLGAEVPETQGTSFDYGGWYRFSFTRYDDPDMRRKVSDHDLRIWGSLAIADVHQFYFRGRIDIIDWAHGASPTGQDHDVDGMNLDEGWYRLRLGRFMQKLAGGTKPIDVDLKMGRQFLEVGRGAVFSQIFDAGLLTVSNFHFNMRVFAGQSVASDHNLDISAPKYWHDHRTFIGFQGTLKNVLPRIEPYVYGLWVDDHNPSTGEPVGQGFGYDPKYIGVGARANPIPDVHAWTEFILEDGKSYAAGTMTREPIEAHAFIAGAEFLPSEWFTRPRIEVEFGLGSGDSDRGNPTSTVNGNTPGTKDDGFLAYGYYDTGVAFAPRLANLQVLRTTASFHPFEFLDCMRDLELGASFYWFQKDKRTGGVSDASATLPKRGLGTELDLFANWRLTSDLLWTVRWGKHNLGSAYPNSGDSREYLLTTFTYNF